MAGRKKSCKTCMHWKVNDDPSLSRLFLNDWAECIPAGTTEREPDYPLLKTTAMAHDHEAYGAWLVTQGRHYCLMYEKVEA